MPAACNRWLEWVQVEEIATHTVIGSNDTVHRNQKRNDKAAIGLTAESRLTVLKF